MEHEFDRRNGPPDEAARDADAEPTAEPAEASRRDAGSGAAGRDAALRRALGPDSPAWRMRAPSEDDALASEAASRVVDGPALRAEARAAASLEAEGADAAAQGAGFRRWPATVFLAERLRSFGFAIEGVRHLVATQPNAWIHSAATAAVVGLGLGFGLGRLEWAAVALAIALVWFAEAMNTAFEHLCDVVEPDFHPSVKRAKDVAAGAVLLAAICAAITGLLVFVPHFWALLAA